MKKFERKLFLLIRKGIYISFAKMSFFDKNQIAIFCYHAIGNDNWQFSVDLSIFKEQIEFLLKTRKPISVEEIFDHITQGKKITGNRFLITFDDGYKDILKAENFLSKKGIKPLVFVLSKPQIVNRLEIENYRPFLTHKDILFLKKKGWSIGCHSATHSDFSKLVPTDIKREILDSKIELEKRLKLPINYFAYPKGSYSQLIIKQVSQAGYKMAFSVDGGFINSSTNRFIMPRIGVDRTHSMLEFPALYSTPVLYIRKIIGIINKNI